MEEGREPAIRVGSGTEASVTVPATGPGLVYPGKGHTVSMVDPPTEHVFPSGYAGRLARVGMAPRLGHAWPARRNRGG